MDDQAKTKTQLIDEIETLRRRVKALEAAQIERQQVEQQLRDSENRYRNLFEESPISLWEEDWSEVKQWVDHLRSQGISDLEAYFNCHPEAINTCAQAIKIVDVNRATLKLFKAAHKAALMSGLQTIFDEENYRLTALQELLPLFEGQTRHAYEKTNRTLAGDKLHVLVRLAIAPGYEQTWSRVLVSITDITARKQIEQALRESEARYRSVIMTMAEGVILQDAEGGIQTCNANAERILGLSAAQMMGRTSIDPRWRAVHEDGSPFPGETQPAMLTLQTGQAQADVIMGVHKPEGGLTWISINAQPLFRAGESNPYAVVASLTDITGRKRAEQEIRRRNRELTLLNRVIEAATVDQRQPDMLLETACRELALAFNLPHTLALLFGQDKRQATVVAEYRAPERSSWLAEVIPLPELARSEYLQAFKSPWLLDQTRTGAGFEPLLARMRRAGLASMLLVPLLIETELIGALSLNTVRARSFSDEEINLVAGVAHQVSGAVAQARLAQTRQLLTTALEQSAESVIITDTSGTILYVNPAFERVAGYTRAEALNQNPRMLKGDQQQADFYRELWQTITAGQVWHGRFINQKKDGSSYTAESTITPVRDSNNLIVNYVAVQRDVTHELRLEAQYRQAQKMEAVGRLAGGIAHDFNNILTIIIGNVGLMLDGTLGPEHPLYKDLTQIQNAAGQAASLTRQLLAFSRRQVLQPRVLDLNAVIGNIEKMLRRLIGEDIELVTILAPDLGQIKIDPGQIEQVIMNLVINARDAMPAGGKLLIETANAGPDEGYLPAHAGTEIGSYVLLAVSDTGSGMDQETLAHVFEPFFTTKAMGHGTGLGLATIHGIVNQSGGYIRVYSEPGYGATFKIYLPLVEQALAPAGPARPAPQTPSGSAAILLVEDEIAVREIAGRILRSQGYQVLEANNGREASHMAGRYQGRIDLLLTDVVMPGDLSGPQLAQTLSAQRPALKVLYMSGYTDNVIVHHGVLKAGIHFLQKPFSPAALLHKVQDVLRA